MRHPVSRELFAYWEALRAGRSAPERSAIDPAAIRHLLAYTFLLEIGQGAEPRSRAVSFRLSGTRLNALFRRELKGSAFAQIWTGGDRAEAAALLQGVLDDCAPAVAGLSGGPGDHDPASFEMLLLPLRHHGRTHARLLGSIAAEAVPSWIGLRAISHLRLTSFRTILPRDPGRLGRFGAPAAVIGGPPNPAAAPPTAPSRMPAVPRPRRFQVHQGGRSSPAATGRAADLG